MSKNTDQKPNDVTDELTDKQRAELEDDPLQAKYQAAYELQMQRQSCPGCGD